MSDIKTFDAKADLYDLDTFVGRYSHFKQIINPRNLFYSNENLKQFQKNIDDFTLLGKSEYSNKELWEQSYIVKSNLHPETKEPLQMPFRWSCFVPCNIP